MTYSILDTGNLVVSFDREDEATSAFARIAQESSAPDDLVMLTFDDAGSLVAKMAAEAVTAVAV